MQHVDDDVLTSLALQLEEPGDVAAHLDSCPRCHDELEALRRVVTAGRLAPQDSDLIAPPAHVWERITAAIGSDLGADPRSPDMSRVQPRESEPSAVRQTAEPTREPPRHAKRAPTWLMAAAAFVVGAVAAGTLVAVISDDDASPTGATTVANAELEPLGSGGTAGSAEVVDDGDNRLLDVRIDDRASGAGYREVWLLDAEATRLVSLGVLTGTSGQLVIPDGLDLADFPVVDVSREPLDGDPAHSGDSIARGALDI